MAIRWASPSPSSFLGRRFSCSLRPRALAKPCSTQRRRTRSTVAVPTFRARAISGLYPGPSWPRRPDSHRKATGCGRGSAGTPPSCPLTPDLSVPPAPLPSDAPGISSPSLQPYIPISPGYQPIIPHQPSVQQWWSTRCRRGFIAGTAGAGMFVSPHAFSGSATSGFLSTPGGGQQQEFDCSGAQGH